MTQDKSFVPKQVSGSEPLDDLLLLFRSRIAALFGTGLESVDDKLTVQCVDEVIRLRAENKELRVQIATQERQLTHLTKLTAGVALARTEAKEGK